MMIRDALKVPAEMRDVKWLRASLQLAIRLELATIPVYLCGMWSVIDPSHDVRRYIKTIVVEEMLHMGWACNMLTTLGGGPVFNTADTAPRYPGRLPGGVRPDMRVWLAGFSRAMARGVYMEIETPQHEPVTRFFGEEYPTIGAFYNALRDAFRRVPPGAVTGERQLSSPMLGLTPICSVEDACEAIRIIREQGEGTEQDPFPPEDPNSRAHYYRFAEMYYGQKLVKSCDGWDYTGDPVPLPHAFPMAEVPEGGYPESRCFDKLYTRILDDLQAAWTNGEQWRLDCAVQQMKALEGPARELMQQPLPTQAGTLGPSFQLVR
jgi:hypothetical protein